MAYSKNGQVHRCVAKKYYQWSHWGKKFYYGPGKQLTAQQAREAAIAWEMERWKKEGYGN